MSLAEKFEVIADSVYEKGMNKLWNCITNNGNRTNYYFAFMNTNFSNMTIPDGLCKPKTRITSMFNTYAGEYLPKGIDCSGFDVSSAATYHATTMFQYAFYLKSIYDMGIPAQKSYANTFQSCVALESIEVLRSDANTVWNNTFSGCSNLTELTIEGEIGQNGFDVSPCKKLSLRSLQTIVVALANKSTDTSGTTWKVTFGGTNVAKLTDAEINIMETKGWDYA
jgi:hypothetical protein